MSIQMASNELHRAFIVTDSGRILGGAQVALDAQELAMGSRSKHSSAVAARAHEHVVSVIWRLEQNDADEKQIEKAKELIAKSRQLMAGCAA